MSMTKAKVDLQGETNSLTSPEERRKSQIESKKDLEKRMLEEFQRPRMCCGVCKLETFLNTAMIATFLTDVGLCILAAAFIGSFIFGTSYWHFLDSYIADH